MVILIRYVIEFFEFLWGLIMEFRTYEDLNHAILENLSQIPDDVDLIVGIPRSGLMVASILALYLNRPLTSLDDFLNGELFSSGITKPKKGWIHNISEARKILIVEDSVSTGTSINTARKAIESQCNYADRCIYLAVYVCPEMVTKVDIALEILPLPRIFQWNFMQHVFLHESCCDIDGVLCDDPTSEENDDGPRYREFLLNAKEKLHPGRRVHYLVTSRLEKYRAETEYWLNKHKIAYDKLIMMDLPSAAERQRLGNHAAFKAKFYSKVNDATLFIESNDAQAREIFIRTNKPVFCIDSQKYYCDHNRELLIARRQKVHSKISGIVHRYTLLTKLNNLRKRLVNKR